MLPDNILLEIFDLCRENHYNHPTYSRPLREWNIIVHVCSRWRQIVFASPQRLDLQILCTYGTPVKKILEIWPTLPISLDLYSLRSHTSNDEENAIIALKHPDRVSSVTLYVTGSQFGNIVTVMQEPSPMLARLYICLRNGNAAVLPCQFLGWICTTFTGTLLISHPLSDPTNTSFVGQRPCRPPPSKYTPDWLHFTQGDGYGFGRIAPSPKSFHRI